MTGRLQPGLCSITLRQLDVAGVVAVAAEAGVEGIEWGADVHVPPGDTAATELAVRLCRDHGIEVTSYGSYLGAGPSEPDELEMAAGAVFDTALALGTSLVRIWTQLGVLSDGPAEDRNLVVRRTARLATLAQERKIDLAVEFHPGTLTDTADSARRLLEELAAPNLRTHWQPDPRLGVDDAIDGLTLVLPWLAHLHVFSWGPDGFADRRALADGAELWTAALELASDAPSDDGNHRFALCEYVRDDEPDQLRADVATLRRWLESTSPPPA